jgi:hypothetical protein
MRIDEARREHEAVEVDRCGIGRSNGADLGDTTIANRNVGTSRWCSGAVHDRCAPKNEIHDASPKAAVAQNVDAQTPDG